MRRRIIVLLWCAFLLCLTPAAAYGQQPDVNQISNGDQFINALFSACHADLSCGSILLSKHTELINEELWQRLVGLGDSNRRVALMSFGLALEVASKLDNKPLLAATYYKRGWYQFGQGNINVAIEDYLKSKETFEVAGLKRDLIYVLADLGSLYIYASDYNTARRYSEESLKLAKAVGTSNVNPGAWPDEYGVGTALSNLGNVSRHESSYDTAIDYFKKSLAAYSKINSGGKHNLEILDDLADIGRTYNSRGDYLRALSYLSQALDLAKAGYPDRVASVSNSLGILYTNQRDYAKAIELFQTGLELAIRNSDRFRQADMLLNIGVAYQFQQDYSSALKNYDVALQLAKQINYSELLVPIYEGKGVVLKAQARYQDALDTFEAGLELAKQNHDQIRMAELLWREAEIHLLNHNASKSIQDASAAIARADQLSLMNVKYLALTVLGRAYRANGDNDSAMRTFTRAIAQIEEMRTQIAGLENERQLFFEDKVVPYYEMVDILISQNKGDGNQQALLVADSAKARVLLDVFSTGRIDLARVMSDDEKTEQSKLNQNIVDLNNKISQEGGQAKSDDAMLRNLNEQLRLARSQYESFQNSLYAAHAELKTRTGTSTATLQELSALTNPSTAFLEYVVTDSKTYLFVLTRVANSESPVLRAYPIAATSADIAKRIRTFRDAITTQSAFADDARNLYDLLLKPAEEQLKGKTSLCIVPDGMLWDLPFQALQVRDRRYVLEDYAISYAPSLSVLKEMSMPKKHEPASASLLAFGNPTMPAEIAANIKTTYRGENLGPLPDAELEVGTLKDIWGPSSSRIFVGANASKNAFRSEASKYNIIHLATHGILDDASPMYSRLVLARAGNDPSDDGLLEAREIMRLDLHADLVVLSACQTARGRIGAGEGIVGMSWAFFVAGVPTMVASQWKVDSASTAKLMIDFHKRLKEQATTTRASALQQASLSLMKDPRYRHPYFWAGFVMIGKGS